MITVELPDGRKLEFPNGTPENVMRDAINSLQGGVGDSMLPPAMDTPAGGSSVNEPNLSRFVQGANQFDGDMAAMFAGARDLNGFGFMENVDAAVLGGLLGGTPEGTHGVDLFNYDTPTADRYAGMRDQTRAEMDAFQEESPLAFGTGNVLGGVATSIPFAPRLPPTAGMREIMKQLGIFGGVEGALIGGGMGDGETMGEVAADAATGALIGAPTGALAVPAIAGAQRLLSDPIGGVLGAIRGVPNEARAGRVVSRAFNRAGMTPDDVLSRIGEAAADGQDMFRTADALGLPGQRQLAGINRSPGDASRIISEWLDERQLGQNERVSSFLADAVGTDQTAQARQLALQAERRADAGLNYDAARDAATPVNLTGTLDVIDTVLRRNPILGDTALDQGPLGQRLLGIRNRLASEGEQLIDFDTVLGVKSDVFQMMQQNPRVAEYLRPTYSALDAALEQASDGYRLANDTYRQQSGVIDAVQQGREAARPSVRTDDALSVFNRLAPQQTPAPPVAGGMSQPNPQNLPVPYQPPASPQPNPQDGFRVGFVDPLLARIENMPETVNSARPLMTPKTQAVLGAISEDPEMLARRLQREMEMFQTRNMATGGSPTANLLQDIEDVADTSPNLAQIAMNPTQSIINALGTRAGNFMQGTNEQTRQLIARVLLSADPQKELEPLLRAAMMSQNYNRGFEAIPRQLGYQLGLSN
jgi:hypothetical protein